MSCRTGGQLVFEGHRWITRHPAEWMELQRLCLDMRRRHKRITRNGLYLLADIEGFDIANDNTVRRDNTLWSTLARYLLKYHPELKGAIWVKDCEVDREVRANGLPDLDEELILKEEQWQSN